VYHNQMGTLLSFPCQLRLGVVLRCLSLSLIVRGVKTLVEDGNLSERIKKV